MDTKESDVNPSLTLTAHAIKVLLVDDQPIIAEVVRKMLADEKDISIFYCQDPAKALKMADQIQPTVILQDLVMPDVDGMLLCRYFRAQESTHNVPMIVLSATEDPKTKAEAFAIGANDYIVKLPDKLELAARIRYHSQAYISLLQRDEAHQKLLESQKKLNEELAEAAEYVRSLLPEKYNSKGLYCFWRFIPSAQLGGDAFSYQWLDDTHFAIYLLDVCGHGIRAALLSISIINVMRSHSLPGVDFCDPVAVFSSLNDMFPMEKQNDMFFTMWYGIYNIKESSLTYSSAGHPPALLIRKNENKSLENVFRLSTPGLFIGGHCHTVYTKETIKIKPDDILFVYSDGIFEIPKDNGSMMNLNEFIALTKKIMLTAENSTSIIQKEMQLEKIISKCQNIQGKTAFDDDCSLLYIHF